MPKKPDIKPDIKKLNYYKTSPEPCPYLENEKEEKLFTQIKNKDKNNNISHISELTRLGFRRSLTVMYRPDCSKCDACTPIRIDCKNFKPNHNFRRIIKKNQHLKASFEPPKATSEQYDLFIKYQFTRHNKSEMAKMSSVDYKQMIEEGAISTQTIEFRTPDKTLIAAMLIDILDDGYSAIYSFFNPKYHKQSLGTFMILQLISEAKNHNLPYIYLGYHIKNSQKMEYKSRFTPLEKYRNGHWIKF